MKVHIYKEYLPHYIFDVIYTKCGMILEKKFDRKFYRMKKGKTVTCKRCLKTKEKK